MGRAFNVREGISRKDDSFPERILRETLTVGPAKIHAFPQDELLNEYYAARGWDLKTGVPTMKKLKDLELHDVIHELKNSGIQIPDYSSDSISHNLKQKNSDYQDNILHFV